MAWLKNRFRFAFAGFRYGMLRDRSIRLQFILGAMAIAAGAVLKIDVHEWMWVLLSITLVIMAEIFNSCIEKTVDYISLERNPQAGVIKDMAASAVLCASIFALIVACFVFLPHLRQLFG